MKAAIEIQDRQVTAALNSLIAFGANPKPALEEIGADIEQSTRLRFDRSVDPTGTKWKALAWATILNRTRRSRSMVRGGPLVTKSGLYRASFQRSLAQGAATAKPLMDTRTHLYQTLSHKADKTMVIIGVSAPWASIHQKGGYAGRGHKVYIPARPIFGLTVEDRSDIYAVLARHATRALLSGATTSLGASVS